MSLHMGVDSAVTVGTALGVEWFGHRSYSCTKSEQHVAHHVIPLDEETVPLDLARRVTVADMPGKPGQITLYLEKLLLGGDDPHNATVLQYERLVSVDRGHLGQIHKKPQPARGGQHPAAQRSRLKVQNDHVVGFP